MSYRSLIPALVAGICLFVSLPLHASDPEALLKKAEKYYEQLEYEAALKTLIELQQQPSLDPVQRARAFLYMGVCFTALGRAENAVQAFMAVLKLRPQFRLPNSVSPSIRAMFSEALKRMNLPDAGEGGAAAGIALTAKAPHSAPASGPIEVKIGIQDPQKLAKELVLSWRQKGATEYSTIQVDNSKGEAEITATIPTGALKAEVGRLEYYLVAKGDNNVLLAQVGTPDKPKRIQLTEPEFHINWRKWALWGGIGVGVVAATVVAIVLATSGGTKNGANVTVTVY